MASETAQSGNTNSRAKSDKTISRLGAENRAMDLTPGARAPLLGG